MTDSGFCAFGQIAYFERVGRKEHVAQGREGTVDSRELEVFALAGYKGHHCVYHLSVSVAVDAQNLRATGIMESRLERQTIDLSLSTSTHTGIRLSSLVKTFCRGM